MKWSAKMKHARVISIIVYLLIMVVAVNMGCGGKPSERETDSTADISKSNTETKPTNVNGWKGACDFDSENVPSSLFHSGRHQVGGGVNSLKIDNQGRANILYHDNYSRKMFTLIADGKRFELNGDTQDCSNYDFLQLPIGNSDEYEIRMCIDSLDRKHFLTWDDAGIYYFVWDDTGWKTIDGLELDLENLACGFLFPALYENPSFEASFELDSKDNPSLALFVGHNIHYYHWDGLKWITSNGSKYDHKTNDGLIYTSTSVISQLELLFDVDDTPHIVWMEKKEYCDPICIKTMIFSDSKWLNITSPLGIDYDAVVDLRGKHLFINIYDFYTVIDEKDVFHLAWEYRDTDDSLWVFCYMKNDNVARNTGWRNINGEMVEKAQDTNTPVSIEHIDERGYLHHIGIANCDISGYPDPDLLHTMWNGNEWVNVKDESVPAEGDESCLFYINYNDRPPSDFIIKTFKNNVYIIWHQWSKTVSRDIHYMEWIEE